MTPSREEILMSLFRSNYRHALDQLRQIQALYQSSPSGFPSNARLAPEVVQRWETMTADEQEAEIQAEALGWATVTTVLFAHENLPPPAP